jgi:hypothetical protein
MRSWHAEFRAGRCNAVQAAYWQPKPSEELYEIASDPYEIRNLIGDARHAAKRDDLRRRLRSEIIATRDTGFIPEGMFARLAGDKTIYEYTRSPAYPIERIVDLADQACSRDASHLPALEAALDDAHPVIRYWGAVGCLVLQGQGAPLQDKLRSRLNDDWADVRVAAAEAMGYLGDVEQALAALTGVIRDGEPYEKLAALNALDFMWKAGQVPLTRAQEMVGGMQFSEPVDRIPRYLLSEK